ncbi:hypothetical protein DOTSEDRAFT_22343 [Lecanosticta acicola]|uniref:C2H2-type domain-containing protein n=1 Tax=Lecanosticta acicola TaxID=111012 RepID=A0AAI8Z516_9PEZI|nr:hypothetical protein DOTSEDRAFT_22343 [Lecanosticta acicola]
MQDAPGPTRHSSSTQEQDIAAQGAERSSYTTESTEAGPSDAPPGSGNPTPVNPSVGQSGSIRETTEMYRSSTPPEPSSSGSIKYTRTGRVSKATKGQRVHHCDECGKTYTRAEHLRRHQQNHKPGAFPCDVAGCNRSFHREDLLVRHKARQAPKRLPIPHHELGLLSGGGIPISVEDGLVPLTNPWDRISLSPDSSDDFSVLPCQPHSSRARCPSDASLLGYSQLHSASRSPVLAGSAAIYPSQWPSQMSLGPNLNTCIYNNPNVFPCANCQSINVMSYDTSGALFAAARDCMERADLDLPGTASLRSSSSHGFEFLNVPDHSLYLDSYWSRVHELYPVVHRPTFNPESTSPLLRAAMIALGGQALGDRTALSNARVLHEKCVKVLKKVRFPSPMSDWERRSIVKVQQTTKKPSFTFPPGAWPQPEAYKLQRTINNNHTYRVCDMQAILLIEVYSVFKSRRPPLQFSDQFEHTYRTLSRDYNTVLRASSEPPSEDSFPDSAFESGLPTINALCRQRLLLACYLVEQQSNALFGRSSAINYGKVSEYLPFPSPQISWDTPLGLEPDEADTYPFDQLRDALGSVQYVSSTPQERCDAFRSSLMIASCSDLASDGFDGADDYQLLLSTENSSRMRLAHHTSLLCRNAPVRDLLAVAGESWIMAEKLGTQSEFSTAQIEVRQWASGSSSPHGHSIQRAVDHALSILAIHQEVPRTGLLYQEWALYLATVVIWARAYVSHGEARVAGPSLSVAALESSISSIISAGPVAASEWPAAYNVLLWTKAKIEQADVPHNCGLCSGALDVLGKLVARGGDNGWA